MTTETIEENHRAGFSLHCSPTWHNNLGADVVLGIPVKRSEDTVLLSRIDSDAQLARLKTEEGNGTVV